MMYFKKRLAALSFALAITAAALCTPAAAYEAVPVRINGEAADIDARLIGTTTYVELEKTSRLLTEATGAAPGIEAEPGALYITSRGRYLGGSENLTIDGQTYVPVRSAAKVYCAGVEWREPSRSVDIYAEPNSGLEPGSEYYIDDEVKWLSRIIYAESGAEPFAGKILVGNVILNRMFSDEFPNTIYDVIFDRKYGVQFSPVANGSIWNTPNADSVAAAKICLDAYYLSRDALYFLNPDLATNFWIPNNRDFLIKVGGHEFYS